MATLEIRAEDIGAYARLVLKANRIDAEAVVAEQRFAGVLPRELMIPPRPPFDKRRGSGRFRFGRQLWNAQGRAENSR